MKLNAKRVEEVFLDCLFRDVEDTSEYIEASGITCRVGFNPQRLEGYREEIKEMLGELPETFKRSVGGGWSFLQACDDRHGEQWTSFHLRMEQLFLLGIGIGLVKEALPRDMWKVLPGGMPYYIIEM